MKSGIPTSIEHEILRTLALVDSGRISYVEAGANFTHLNFHPDIEKLTNKHIRTTIEDIGPDLEIETLIPEQLWKEILGELHKAGISTQ